MVQHTGYIGWRTDCITDSFYDRTSAGQPIAGRITDTGGKTWTVTDGSDWQVFPHGTAAALSNWPVVTQIAAAYVVTSFADGTIHADVSPIGESNNPAFRDGLIFRHVDNDNFWVFFNYRSPGGTLQYYLRCYSGGALVYDSGALTAGVRDTGGPIPLEVILSGSSIKAYYDGVLRQDITNSTHLSAVNHGVNSLQYGVSYFSACPAA